MRRYRRFAWRAGLAMSMLVACGVSSFAQGTNGSVAGQLADPSGGAVADARLVLLNEETGIEQTVTSDESGRYVFPSVSPGVYTLLVETMGFKTYAVGGLHVEVAQQVTRDIRLELGKVEETVEVSGGTPLLNQRSADVSQVIGQRQIVELPLNGRDFLDLAKLVPGVAQLAGTSQSTGLAINGQRANQIGFYFDGMDTRTEERGKPAFRPSVEAIQEFRIQESNFSAEYGRTPAAINLTLRPGTNDVHGTVFEFLRDDAFDARDVFSPTVDPLNRDQFGAVVGGPILRNKTFFMANYEGLRTSRDVTQFHSVPTDKQRRGNFSDDDPIFDPATYDPQTSARQPFPGNIIRTERFSQIGRAALEHFPESNIEPVSGFNYVAGTTTTDDSDQVHVRVDHHLNDHSHLFGRYSYTDSSAETPSGLPLTGSIGTTEVHSVTVQEFHTFSQNKLNHFRAGWTFFDTLTTFPTVASNLAVTEFGLGNVNPPSFALGLPRIETVGLSNIGANPFQPQGSREHVYSIADDFTWIAGKHAIKFGFDGRYYRPAGLVQVTPNGILTFENRFATQPGVTGTGNAVADMLLGAVSTARATTFAESNGQVSLKYFYTGYYVQDEIRLAGNLTLNLGLRYEYQTPFKERFNDLAIFDPDTARFLEMGKDIDDLHESDRNNFAPRVGMAWTVAPHTVMRAGAGLFYGQPRGAEFTSFQLSPPFVLDQTLTADPNVPDLGGQLFPAPQVRDAAGNIIVSPTTNVFTLDPAFRTNYTWQWNLGVQREIMPNVLLDVAYVGNSAHGLTGRDLVNQAFQDPDVSQPTPVQSRRPNPNVADVNVVKSIDGSQYHALNIKLDKRFSHGLSVLGAYTWSKATGIGGALSGDQSNAQDARNRDAEHARLEFDQTHRLTVAWIYELPFGSGKSFGANLGGLAGALASGWSVQGTFLAHTGFPLTPRSTVSSNVGRQDQNRPDRVCDGKLDGGARSVERWFDTSCFANHPFGRFGNAGNGIIEGPGLQTFDLALMKNNRISVAGQEITVQFRVEAFNAFNHPAFGDPNMAVGTPQFGAIQSTRIGGRELQLGLKLLF
ncbi:MAG: TonB-dependent receptor plug domain-containing protein [Luteitalea sp.]|nr:TonB-dependent receptor plug domain-containing protein [Luteitalea sp.]